MTYVRGDNTMDSRCAPTGTCAPGAEKSRRWWLDGVGNWKQTEQRDQYGSNSFDMRGTTSFNEYTVAAGAALNYDDNGNLMNDEKNLHYHWDGFNRLHRVTDAAEATVATYVYDSDGRRLMKDLPGTANDVSFALDGWQIVLEYNSADLPQRQYTYGAFINEPLFMDVANAGGNFYTAHGEPLERYYYHQTPIYNVVAITDYGSHELVERYDYDPYGKYTLVVGDTRTEEGASTVGNQMTFTGHWFDRETGMYYMRNRLFSIEFGTFIARDPIYAHNLYRYCLCNPVICVDIYGLMTTPGGGGGLSYFKIPLTPDQTNGYDLSYLDIYYGEWLRTGVNGAGHEFWNWMEGINIKWRTAAFLGSTWLGKALLGDNLAGDFMSHFLDKSGTPVILNWHLYFSGEKVDHDARSQILEIYNEFKKNGCNNLHKRVYDSKVTGASYALSIGKYYREGNHEIKGKGNGSADGYHQFTLHDVYDWENNSDSNDVLNYVQYDAEGNILERYGYAKRFYILSHGSYYSEMKNNGKVEIWE